MAPSSTVATRPERPKGGRFTDEQACGRLCESGRSRGVGKSGRFAFGWYDVLRVLLAMLLLVSAGLKTHELATEPVPAGPSVLDSRWVLSAVVQFEILFGFWLVFGLHPIGTRRLAIVCFVAFACVALYKGISGEPSCGCFGRVQVSPWYTLALDLAVVAALVCCRPATGQSTSAGQPASSTELPGRSCEATKIGWVLALWLAIGLPAGVAIGRAQPAALDLTGEILGDSAFVLLEPDAWLGKPFPLLRYIDRGDRLARDEWIVVLYRHDCPACREMLPVYERLGLVSMTSPAAPRVALFEMPPYGNAADSQLDRDVHYLKARLTDAKNWFVQLPLVIRLNNSRVLSVARRPSDDDLSALGPQATKEISGIPPKSTLACSPTLAHRPSTRAEMQRKEEGQKIRHWASTLTEMPCAAPVQKAATEDFHHNKPGTMPAKTLVYPNEKK